MEHGISVALNWILAIFLLVALPTAFGFGHSQGAEKAARVAAQVACSVAAHTTDFARRRCETMFAERVSHTVQADKIVRKPKKEGQPL